MGFWVEMVRKLIKTFFIIIVEVLKNSRFARLLRGFQLFMFERVQKDQHQWFTTLFPDEVISTRKFARVKVKNEVIMSKESLLRALELLNSFDSDLIGKMETLSEDAKINYERKNISLYEYIDFQRSYIDNKLNFIEANRKYNHAINFLNFNIGSDLKNF